MHQRYWREGEPIRSAKILSVDATSRAAIDALAGNLVETGDPADLNRIRSYSRLIADRDLQWTPTARDEEAGRLIPVRKSDASNANPADRLNGFYALEAHAFADGKRTVLDIRDALSAEFGPLGSDRVRQFFRSRTAAFDLKRISVPASVSGNFQVFVTTPQPSFETLSPETAPLRASLPASGALSFEPRNTARVFRSTIPVETSLERSVSWCLVVHRWCSFCL